MNLDENYEQTFYKVLSKSQIRKLNKQSKHNSVAQTRDLRGSQAISQDINTQFKERKSDPFNIQAKTVNQKLFVSALNSSNKTCIIASGSAGTGKTYLAIAHAAKLFLEKKIDKIILTRPNISTGKTIGLFPGTAIEKMTMWLAPAISLLKEFLGASMYELALKREQIILQPIETIRGSSYNNAIVIIDESQNLEVDEVKAIVTRIGSNSKVVFLGDTTQSDIKNHKNGLHFIENAIEMDYDLTYYSAVIKFGPDDIVRSDICAAWVKYFYYNNL